MNEISQLCALLNFRERELSRLNRLIKYLEDYQKDRQEHLPGFFKTDTPPYTDIRTKLTEEIQSIMKKLE